MGGLAAPVREIRVFLVDDHDLVREGLRSLFGREPDFVVVGDSPTADEALVRLEGTDPDVVIVDYRMPGMNVVDLCREIAERRLRAQVVVLSAFVDDGAVDAALQAGARAYVVKDVEAGDLKRAVRAAARGSTMLDPRVTPGIITWAARLDLGKAAHLRPGEARMLRSLVEGKTNAQIATEMGVSPETVKTYLREVYRKLGVRSRVEAVSAALRGGLV